MIAAGVWAAGSTRFASQLVWSPDPQKYLAHAVSQMQDAEVAIMQLVDEVYGRACVRVLGNGKWECDLGMIMGVDERNERQVE